jgi:glycosyltransferase involved in cell wall biosynthesis
VRILHVDPALTWRGGERQVFLLAAELHRRGHETEVAADPVSPLFRRARDAGIPTTPLRIRGDLDPAAIVALARRLRREPPGVLHLHTARAHAAGGLAARLAGFGPVLVTRRLELPPRGALGRWKYRALGDHFVAISGAVEESLTAAGVPASRISRIPSGVVIPREAAATRPQRPWTVGTLAAFTPQKDPETWRITVEAVCASDPEIRFVWAGEGELRAPLEVALQRAGIADRVRLPGFLADPERDFWPEIDVFFLPSAFEALGTVFLDALARGIPVVATTVGGIPEFVRTDREGLLAAPGDADALAKALGRLRGDPTAAREMGEAGRERARAFEIGGIVSDIVSLYEKLQGQGGDS